MCKEVYDKMDKIIDLLEIQSSKADDLRQYHEAVNGVFSQIYTLRQNLNSLTNRLEAIDKRLEDITNKSKPSKSRGLIKRIWSK